MGYREVNIVRDHSRSEGSARTLLFVMASYMADGVCRRGNQALAAGAHLKRRAVQCQLRALEQLGEIAPVGHQTGGRALSTWYRLTLTGEEKGDISDAVSGEKGAPSCAVSGGKRAHGTVEKGAPDGQKGAPSCALNKRREEEEERGDAGDPACWLSPAGLSTASPRGSTEETSRESETIEEEASRVTLYRPSSSRRSSRNGTSKEDPDSSPRVPRAPSPRTKIASADLDIDALLAAPAVTAAAKVKSWNDRQTRVWIAETFLPGQAETDRRRWAEWVARVVRWIKIERETPQAPGPPCARCGIELTRYDQGRPMCLSCTRKSEDEARDAERLRTWREHPERLRDVEWAMFVLGLRNVHGWPEIPFKDLLPTGEEGEQLLRFRSDTNDGDAP